jgi:hypothetical protein
MKRHTEWGRSGASYCRLPLIRFLEKIEASEDGCWNWTAGITRKGYATFWDQVQNRDRRAHRWAYEWFIGPIPEGLQIDHLCRNRRCVNPTHLEPVTARENTFRGVTIAARNAAKTHCPSGHPFDETNTYRRKSGRDCRACRLIRYRKKVA